MDTQNVGFLAVTLSLRSPSASDLQKAYLGLSARGTVSIACTPVALPATLLAAEQSGFFGMKVTGIAVTALEAKEGPCDNVGPTVLHLGSAAVLAGIAAYKGKEGPCHDTGRTARYLGSAAAVLDDDHHLLYGTLRICEKTARLYGSDAYSGLIEVSEAQGALLARLERDPVPFDCDTFEADAKALAASLSAPARSGGPTAAVFYPGPFRLLILRDGTMVRRGRIVRISETAARELADREGAWLVPEPVPGSAAPPQNFSELYRERGAACLLDSLAGASASPKGSAFDALDLIPAAMRRRLLALISRGEEYFILTGSDPAQKDGCCPSNEVGVANGLVDAGILQSQGTTSGADCPVTLYAFASEIRSAGGKPAFSRNGPLRDAVRARLEGGPRLGPRVLARLALAVLLAAAVVTLAVALVRQLHRGG